MNRWTRGSGKDHPGRRKGWIRRGRWLVKTRTFKDFRDAMAWVGRVATLSERLDHHPDIHIRWNRVTLRLTTHEAEGLTAKDWRWVDAEDELWGGDRGTGS